MKIREITEAPVQQLVVKKDDANKTVLQDPQSGTTTIIDKKKNKQAQIQQDPKNPQKATMKDPATSVAQGKPGAKVTTVKPGTKVTVTK